MRLGWRSERKPRRCTTSSVCSITTLPYAAMLRSLALLATVAAAAARVSKEPVNTLVKLAGPTRRPSELVPPPPGVELESVRLPQPISYLDAAKLPANFTCDERRRAGWHGQLTRAAPRWGNVAGVGYLTRILNQHVPQARPPGHT